MQAERRCEQCGQLIPWGEQKCPACGKNGRFLWSMRRNTLLLLSFLVLIILFVVTTFAVKAFRAKDRGLARQWYVSGERELAAGRAEAALEDFRSALAYAPNDSLIELELAHALAAAGHLPEARAYLLEAPFIPVVHRADLTKLEGIVSLKDILKAYREAQLSTKPGRRSGG
jgi:tetratricopeptide (TPR) repeat protein